MGDSGLGKTTILNLIAGFLTPQAGTLYWYFESLMMMAPENRPIAYLFQSHHVFEHLTVYDNIILARYRCPTSILPIFQQRLKAVMMDFNLNPIIHQKASTLSGGQKQRVALARLILQHQSLWLLDEPFNGLDRQAKEYIFGLLQYWQQQIGATILFTTHHEDEIQAFATHRYQLYEKDNCIRIGA